MFFNLGWVILIWGGPMALSMAMLIFCEGAATDQSAQYAVAINRGSLLTGGAAMEGAKALIWPRIPGFITQPLVLGFASVRGESS